MKKILLLIGVLCSMQFAQAQQSAYTEKPNHYFTQGKEMFLDNNYVGAINTLKEFIRYSNDKQLIEEAEYYIISSQYYKGEAGIEPNIKEFIRQYPSNIHRHQLAFYAASMHFEQKEWKRAIIWFYQSDLDYLSPEEQEDHSYRRAYASMQTGDWTTAKRLFGLLSQRSSKYDTESSYYLAYSDFQGGNYASSLPVFRRLKDNDKFREKAILFLIQGSFLEGKHSDVIKDGKEYTSKYPNTDSAREIYRLMASSYYKTGQMQDAILYYEQYTQLESNPIREDMYQLADAYYRNNHFAKAINALKFVASSNDRLGQAGNMLLGQSYLKLHDTSNALLAFEAASRVNFSPIISESALYNYVMLMSEGSVSTFGESITALQLFLTKYPKSQYTDKVNNTLASTLLSVKNYPVALNAINNIKNPSDKILEAKQVILYQMGVQEFINGKYNQAINHFTATINQGNHNIKSKNEAYLWRGDSYYRNGNYQAANNDYTSYTQLARSTEENYALAYYNLGYTHFQLEDYTSALNDFKTYVASEKDKKAKNYSDALNRIGDCYLYNRNFSQAESFYAQASGASPSGADYSDFQKAFVLGMQKNYSAKVTALDKMMAKYPESMYYGDALYEKSRALVMLNREKDAINVIEQLLTKYPKTNLAPKAGVQLGQLYFNINNPQKSIAAYKKVVANYPNTPEAGTAIKSMEGVYKDINDISSYASYLSGLGRGNILSASRQDSLTYLAAENIYMKEKKAEAKNALNGYLQSYPNGVFASDAHFYLGNMDFEAKNFKGALVSFKEVIAANNPKYLDDALILTSGIEFDQKDYAAAYESYKHLNEIGATADNKHTAQLGMMRCAYLTNRDKEVVEAATSTLASSTASEEVVNEARFYRGKSYKNLGQNKEATADFKVVAKNTRTAFGAESQYLLAEIYSNAKDYDQVEKQVSSFMKAGTSHEYWMARSIILLADSYIAKGENFQAKQYLESLQANYKGGEKDIKQKITESLSKLDKQ